MNDPNRCHAGCGGEIEITGCGPDSHLYCTRCNAFMLLHQPFPTGMDRAANLLAYDNRMPRSPEDGVTWEWVSGGTM